jgi:predicted nucleic acid-binding protein
MILIDTNVLARSIQADHPTHAVAVDALAVLIQEKRGPCLVPQVLYELWTVSTRPVKENGLGLLPAQASAILRGLRSQFRIFLDEPIMYQEWEDLLIKYGVSGKGGHDARIVAAMNTHGIGRLLTFNSRDFQRFNSIELVSPTNLVASPSS